MVQRIIWFEHMYQPSWNFVQRDGWDPKRMIDECYRPNALLMKKLGIKMNMNITQTMHEFFTQNNALDVLEIYKELAHQGQVELVGSTAHHILAIQRFAKVLNDEIRDQHRFITLYFGKEPTVFFPPEMAIDQDTENLVASHGYHGIIVSGGTPNFAGWETTGVFENHIKIFAHNGILSGQFSFPVNGFHSDHDMDFVFRKIEEYQLPVLLAFDHESFGGYHNPHMLKMKQRFFEIAKGKGWEFVHFSDLLHEQPYGCVPGLKATTWVGDYSKWDALADRTAMIDKILDRLTPENAFFVRKWILPSCHLHVDYATDLFWEYAKHAGMAA